MPASSVSGAVAKSAASIVGGLAPYISIAFIIIAVGLIVFVVLMLLARVRGGGGGGIGGGALGVRGGELTAIIVDPGGVVKVAPAWFTHIPNLIIARYGRDTYLIFNHPRIKPLVDTTGKRVIFAKAAAPLTVGTAEQPVIGIASLSIDPIDMATNTVITNIYEDAKPVTAAVAGEVSEEGAAMPIMHDELNRLVDELMHNIKAGKLPGKVFNLPDTSIRRRISFAFALNVNGVLDWLSTVFANYASILSTSLLPVLEQAVQLRRLSTRAGGGFEAFFRIILIIAILAFAYLIITHFR